MEYAFLIKWVAAFSSLRVHLSPSLGHSFGAYLASDLTGSGSSALLSFLRESSVCCLSRNAPVRATESCEEMVSQTAYPRQLVRIIPLEDHSRPSVAKMINLSSPFLSSADIFLYTISGRAVTYGGVLICG